MKVTIKQLCLGAETLKYWNHYHNDEEAITIYANNQGVRPINDESHLIICNDSIDMGTVTQFIKSNCTFNLKSIKLQTNIHLDYASLELMTKQLKNIKSLDIDAIGVHSEIFNGLLKHCKILEHLQITHIGQYNTDWLRQQYLKLKSVSIRNGYLDDLKIGEFFRLNPNITDGGSQELHFKTCKISNVYALNVKMVWKPVTF